MTESITEWEFTADVAKWIDRIITADSRLPFKEAKCEQRGSGSQKRRDLTLIDKYNHKVLTGEVKLPYRPDGGSPYNEKLVQDARKKAAIARTDYFFTWNVNEFVLWETFPPKTFRKDRKYKSWKVTNVAKESHLLHPMTINAIQNWLPDFLNDFSNILRGKITIAQSPPDDKFIDALESFLAQPINLTLEELVNRYKSNKFKAELDKWMREEQGWTISDHPEDIRDNLERAAKFACYAMVNRLVFYEALLKRYGARMPKLSVPKHIHKGDDLRNHLAGYFEQAKKETGDYETVLGEEYRDIGSRIPFYSDRAVEHWRALIDQINQFDFSKLDYEVIGRIFERLISPEERHKYGQHYTRPEVVDLINSFCIRSGEDKVMDPACGGGTFLVRAYARKRELAPGRNHGELLSDLYGIDISHFATHLTTINLATRDLIDQENYPQIARSDFFDIRPDLCFVKLPRHVKGAKIKTKGLGAYHEREVVIKNLDAVVGNPPYVRYQLISKDKREQYQSILNDAWNLRLSGQADLHCYFWPHATSFLKEEGHFGFLTSSQWLDAEYGFRLQEWLLKDFEILAIFESIDEPWFVGARVITAITILRRQKNEDKRMKNIVRFVQLRRPITEILANDGTTAGQVNAADSFRDEIISITKNTHNERYRARLVRQGELWSKGVEIGNILRTQKSSKKEDIGHRNKYYGGKWGVYLHAPNLWFKLLDEGGNNFCLLSELAEIQYGLISGYDSFFYVKDFTKEILNLWDTYQDWVSEYDVSYKDFKSGRLRAVKCGDNYNFLRPIESKYLEPEVHSLMEIDKLEVLPDDCKRLAFVYSKLIKDDHKSFAVQYIKWGEREGYNQATGCIPRGETNTWYNIASAPRGSILWPRAQQYKHCVPLNPQKLLCNNNMISITPLSIDTNALAGILNSTLAVLAKYQYGRPVGVEGNLKTETVDIRMMLIPDPRKANKKQLERIAAAFNQIKKRNALYFLPERRLKQMAYTQAGKIDELNKLSDHCELDMPDRRELDDSVLEILGIESKKRRDELITELYNYLKEFYELTRQKEEKAIENKKRSKRRGPARPGEIAAQIFNELNEKEPHWLKHYNEFLNLDEPFDTFDIPEEGVPKVYSDLFVGNSVKFVKRGKTDIIETKNEIQSLLVCFLAESGIRKIVRIPHEDQECQRVLNQYQMFINERDARLWQLVEERTADEEMQGKIYEALKFSVRKTQS